MLIGDENIRELSVDEYFYLTENLEVVNSDTVKGGISYLLINKKKRLFTAVRAAMENELSETERSIALDFWTRDVKAEDIAEKNNISRSSVYRILNNAEKKLKRSLQYVLIYESEAGGLSAQSLNDFIKGGMAYEQ